MTGVVLPSAMCVCMFFVFFNPYFWQVGQAFAVRMTLMSACRSHATRGCASRTNQATATPVSVSRDLWWVASSSSSASSTSSYPPSFPSSSLCSSFLLMHRATRETAVFSAALFFLFFYFCFSNIVVSSCLFLSYSKSTVREAIF